MARFDPKSLQRIVASMAAKMSAETPITDFSDGSVVLTLLETAAVEDFQQYVQMLNIIRNYNLDTTEGEDLDRRASEYGLTRKSPTRHSGLVVLGDSRFDKISTKLFAGRAGPTQGSTTIFVDDATDFPATGQIYIGRGTPNSEGPITYSSAPVDNTSFWTINLDSALINDHGTEETIVLAQFGDRVISAGTEVEIPENDFSDQVLFEINQTITLLDGEDSIENVLVTALDPGGFSVPANSVVAYPNNPFTGATVTNLLPFVNGRNEETDQELRDRIRRTVQSLSRGTRTAILNGIVGLIDEDTNQSIVSASPIIPVVLADGPSKVFIDNGRGLEPSLDSVGLENIITLATGGERFFQLESFPLIKANLVSQNIQPFNLSGGETLIFRVGTEEETFTFIQDDFQVPGTAEAIEVAEAINKRSILVEARTITDDDGRKILVNPKTSTNEDLTILAASTANIALNFSNEKVSTLKLYKNDELLVKDGRTASALSLAQPFNLSTTITSTTDGDITVTPSSRIVTKSVAGSNPFKQLVHPGDYIKFSADADTAFKKVRTVVSDTKFILEEQYTASGGGLGDIVIWNSPQLEVAANGDRDETEIVSFGPNDFGNENQALASEVLERMLKEIQLSKVELAVNDSRINVISEKENSADSKVQITGGAGALALGFSSVTNLTGTVDFTGGEKEVIGTGTAFTSELQQGQWIKADLDGNGSWTKIESIEDDTTLYLTEGYRGLNRSGVATSSIEFGELTQGANRDYRLNRSNGQIELDQPLQAGDTLSAGSTNTRASVDSLSETFDFDSLGTSSNLIICVDGGKDGTVTTGDSSAPYNNFFDSNLVDFGSNFYNGFYIEFVSGQNEGESSFVSSYNDSTGEITTVTDFPNPIVAGDKFILCQELEFTHATDFGDPENVFGNEVVEAINKQLLGAKAIFQEFSKEVRIRTNDFGEEGKIQIKGGTANSVLGFSEEERVSQLANTANVVSGNSDRKGNVNALGYTLGPKQNLIVILDGDAGAATFSIPMEVTGEITSASSANSFEDSNLVSDYSEDDYFNNFWLYWTSGPNEGSVQTVTSYDATTGNLTTSDVFRTSSTPSTGDTFSLIPKTAENVVAIMNDLNTTTYSIRGESEVIRVSGDFVQLSTKTPGSDGKVFVTGGAANSLGIAVQSVPSGSPVNDLTLNSISGLSKGLLCTLTLDAEVTTADTTVPYNTFRASSLITSFANYFNGMEIEFLDGQNESFKTTISSYDNTTGEVVLVDNAPNEIALESKVRIGTPVHIVDIQGSAAPFTVEINDTSDSVIDVSAFTPERDATIRDRNGLNFENVQTEGIDGYKFFTGLIQLAQHTIDGLDRDLANFPGIGAAGTQFEVLTPVLVKLRIIVNITTQQGVSVSSVSGEVNNAILEYINSLGVGENVILSEIICAALEVNGVIDAEVQNHDENIIIQESELARINSSNLIIG